MLEVQLSGLLSPVDIKQRVFFSVFTSLAVGVLLWTASLLSSSHHYSVCTLLV